LSESEKSRIYRIRDWDEIYEVSQSRRPGVMHWVPMRNPVGEDGYFEIISAEDGVALLGAWVYGFIFTASRCKPRGTLIRSSGEPHTVQTINRLSYIPTPILQEAARRFADIGWLEILPYQTKQTAISETAAPHINGKAVDHPAPDPSGFGYFWTAWVRATGSSDREPASKTAWHKATKPEMKSAISACLASYAASDKVARGVIMNPDNWIIRQAAGGWKARWSPARRTRGERIEDNLTRMNQ
jgi:hypothetical protein